MPEQIKKPSQAEIDASRRLLQSRSEPYMRKLVEGMQAGADGVEINPARWIGFLNWLEADVGPQMMKGMRANEPKREDFDSASQFETAHNSWKRSYAEMFAQFEAFSQGRAAMNLNDPKFCKMFVAMIRMFSSASADITTYFTSSLPKIEIDTHRPPTADV